MSALRLDETNPGLTSDDADALRSTLDALVVGARTVLDADLIGVYLTGSFALGGGDAASDVDFLVVSRRDPSGPQERGIRDLHRRLPDRPETWAGRLEGSWVSEPAVRDRPGAHAEWLYVDNGSREVIRSRHDDTATSRWMLRRGVPLAGPSAATLVEEVAPDDVRAEAVVESGRKVHWLRDEPRAYHDGWAQPYAVLTFCRLIYSVRFGTVATKADAAAWVRDEVAPPRFHPLIDAAVAQRLAPYDPVSNIADPAAASAAPAFVAWAADEIRRRSK